MSTVVGLENGIDERGGVESGEVGRDGNGGGWNFEIVRPAWLRNALGSLRYLLHSLCPSPYPSHSPSSIYTPPNQTNVESIQWRKETQQIKMLNLNT